jgi:hypothetical protein
VRKRVARRYAEQNPPVPKRAGRQLMIQRGALLQGIQVWLSQKATAMNRLRARQHYRCHEHSERDKQCESRKLLRGLEKD